LPFRALRGQNVGGGTMPAAPFDIDDAKSFDENTLDFIRTLAADDPLLAEVLERELPRLLRGEIQVSDLWDELAHAAEGADE
jgi:hypothetical protein